MNLKPWRDLKDEFRQLPSADSHYLPESEWSYVDWFRGKIPTVETLCPLCKKTFTWGTTGIIWSVECRHCHQRLNPLFRDEHGNPSYDAWGPIKE